mmetsp:Transcript_29332/g.66248  ORF Transcript_29332/g.66248 Transcript_29332/m.66248 type:complete len:264 (-) Transcript_29332:73-864(-)
MSGFIGRSAAASRGLRLGTAARFSGWPFAPRAWAVAGCGHWAATMPCAAPSPAPLWRRPELLSPDKLPKALWPRSLQVCIGGNGQAQGAPPTDYEMDVGKIADALKSDYNAFFEREPNFEIYDDSIALELGRPFHSISGLRGKRSYRRALLSLQHLGVRTLQDGFVRCQISDGTPYGHTLQVNWTCEGCLFGNMLVPQQQPIYISAISFYTVARQVGEADSRAPLTHRVHRHVIEFVEFSPPSIRTLLQSIWRRDVILQPCAS